MLFKALFLTAFLGNDRIIITIHEFIIQQKVQIIKRPYKKQTACQEVNPA